MPRNSNPLAGDPCLPRPGMAPPQSPPTVTQPNTAGRGKRHYRVDMSILSKWAVLSLGIVFHLAFLWSIFDVYFVSPLVHGMKHHSPTDEPPADRLFLIVGDGLRADKCFGKQMHPNGGEEYLAPFIRSKAIESGTFGISHTRVPTESRPGHVALIAGFYEDVSAVTKGWQENPVDFDSVFNQSLHTWSWGSPDILPMFGRGAVPGRVDMDMYDHTFEDFTKSSIELDRFVFERVEKLFEDAKTNSTLNAELRGKKLIFFLHLLGIDTAGHGYRPYSAEYYDNIKYIDGEIQKLERLVNDFYNDDRTAWIFTSDHGMSDFGSHGDGHPDNTRCPLVVWGAGAAAPKQGTSGHDDETAQWELPVERHDINQADAAPLMSYLVGVDYPANSVGELPLEFLNADDLTKAKAIKANAESIAEQYIVKEALVEPIQLRFKPFPGLSHGVGPRIADIEAMLKKNQISAAISASEELISLSLGGLKYLQKYNWLLLRTLVTMGFLGWIFFTYTSFLHLFVVKDQPTIKWLSGISVVVFAVLAGLLARQQSPLNYYLYALFPVFFWHVVLSNFNTLVEGSKVLFSGSLVLNISLVAAAVGAVEAMVYGYFRREIFSALLVLVFLPWPFVQNLKLSLKYFLWSFIWCSSCLALAVISLLPVVKTENLEMIVWSGICMYLLALFYTIYLCRRLKLSGITIVTCGLQLGLIVLTVFVTSSSVNSLQARKGLPVGSQIVGWMALICSVLVPAMHNLAPVKDWRFQFLNIFMILCPTMIILTISYEGYFYIAFSLLLFSWVNLESRFSKKHGLSILDYRMAIFFLFFTHIAFFGTGNIASISSFSLDSVYRLIPVFNPFTMSALLIFKLLVPFIVLSISLGFVNQLTDLPSYCIFSMVMSITDILSLNFFYLVVDEGSWLDIGTGISHYCICSLLCLFIIFVEYLSSVLVYPHPRRARVDPAKPDSPIEKLEKAS